MLSIRLSFFLLASISVPGVGFCKNHCDAGNIGSLLCSDATIMKLDADLNFAWKNLPCSKQQKTEFLKEQKFWLRERNNCRNEINIRTCLIDKYQSRIFFLNSLQSCDSVSRSYKYGFTDSWYVIKHTDLYLGSTVVIAGSAAPDSCTSGTIPATGILKAMRRNEQDIRIIFKSLSSEQRKFLCTSEPFSHYEGMIKRNAKGVYLYLNNLLGEPL
ncbi:lysozyme inhibitor LprI family protein [Azohydromonas lata]|uniref:Lysozyme inhibitor LprI N-terminal domain-containing protein n=1 Tax=Azohydromonas lata TaxID=45677 RepID=A0ABU5IB27_9BURK|nr:hypothetical protein [Azohydromonas lata]MDZ5456173.1 hypothetical protein [Azohydromonas lata]